MLSKKYAQYVAQMRKIQDITAAISLLHWDNEVYSPPKAAQLRGQQIATLVATAHEWSTDIVLEQLLFDLYQNKEQLNENEAKNVALSWESLQQSKKLSTDFVKQFSICKSRASQAWGKAKKAKNFDLFKNELEDLIAMLRQKAELLGYQEHPYDALLNEYEKGMTVKKLEVLFGDVRQQLVAFAKEIREKGNTTNTDFLHLAYDKDKQWALGLDLLKQMRFDFEAGRQDISTHPFTMNLSPNDVRLTTKIEENNPLEMIGSCIHEGGHGLYEQGLKEEFYGLPLGTFTSLGIHESQSRIWENNVGLSWDYWQTNFPRIKALFPKQLQGIELPTFYKAINQLAPNLIRIQADEIHYHLHVLIRYQIEKGLMEGTFKVQNLAAVWNKMYQDYMGVTVPNDALGILQDIHWSEALFGYFPTYSLGSFYASQFFAQAQKDIPNLSENIAAGNMQPLVDWLRLNIHQYGQKYTSEELCKRITGEGLNLKYFMDYAREKYKNVY